MKHFLILLTAFLALAFTGSLADDDGGKGWCCKKGKCCGDKCYDDWWWKKNVCKYSVHTCKCDDHDDKPVCEQPKDPGPCKGYFKRWYYNAKKGKCLKFIYGGCKGNKNNFKSKEKCLKKCSKDDDGGKGGKDCCKKGYHCCGRKCRYGYKKPWWCGKPKCCKKPHKKRCRKHRHCRWGKYCCRHKCVSKWYAKKKGCI